jgi:hypothetical protein
MTPPSERGSDAFDTETQGTGMPLSSRIADMAAFLIEDEKCFNLIGSTMREGK